MTDELGMGMGWSHSVAFSRSMYTETPSWGQSSCWSVASILCTLCVNALTIYLELLALKILHVGYREGGRLQGSWTRY